MRRPRITSRGARRMEGRREERTRLRRRCRLRRRLSFEDTAAAAARREFDLHLEKMALGQRRRLTRHLTYMHHSDHTHSRRYRWRCSMQSSSCSLQICYTRSCIILPGSDNEFDGAPAILVAPIVGHRLTMLVFTIRQVRNRLLISALHIKTPSLLSHCLFHLPLHLAPFILPVFNKNWTVSRKNVLMVQGKLVI